MACLTVRAWKMAMRRSPVKLNWNPYGNFHNTVFCAHPRYPAFKNGRGRRAEKGKTCEYEAKTRYCRYSAFANALGSDFLLRFTVHTIRAGRTPPSAC